MPGTTFLGIQYAAKTSYVQLESGNPNLDGSGTYVYDLVEASSEQGILVKTIILKAYTNSTLGMVRLFAVTDSVFNLIMEIPVPIIDNGSGTGCTFQQTIPLNYSLKQSDKLCVTTQNSDDKINVIAECLEWGYGDVLPNEGAIYKAVTRGGQITTANTQLNPDDDTDLVSVFVTGENVNTEITSIKIKAQAPTTTGMVRLFLTKGREEFILFAEIMIPGVAQSGSNSAFQCEVIAQGSIALEANYEIMASTQNSEPFSVTVEAFEWSYP